MNPNDKTFMSQEDESMSVNQQYMLVDSFKPRGISDICTDRALIIRMLGERAQDAYEAKSYLAKLSFVDRNRIAVLGWSHGGTTILDLVTSIKRDLPSFKAAIAFYPYCYKNVVSTYH